MKANYNGKTGELGGTASVSFTRPTYVPDRNIIRISMFQIAVVRALSLPSIRGDRPRLVMPADGDYEERGTVAVADDGSFEIQDQYHKIRDVTETWQKCRNVMLEVVPIRKVPLL